MERLSNRRNIMTVIFLSVTTSLFIIMYKNQLDNGPDGSLSKKPSSYPGHIGQKPVKKILIWNWKNQFPVERKSFRKCDVTECEITTDHSAYNSSEAIVVHMPSITSENALPKFRFPWQRWVFWSNHPCRNSCNVSQYNGMFNITQTFRYDSDVHIFWGKTKTVPSGTGYKKNTTVLKNKNKLIAWIVSHCKTQSGRMEYVRELQKHIPVDIYGACTNISCDPHCKTMLENNYKFYLSFENKICKDYVSEKVWFKLKLHVVPIVLGGGDYERYLPPKSYIDIRNFTSPAHLADYIRLLDRNDELYLGYFNWKQSHIILDINLHDFCDLCEYLHKNQHKARYHKRIDLWWNSSNCLSQKTYFQGHVGSEFINYIEEMARMQKLKRLGS